MKPEPGIDLSNPEPEWEPLNTPISSPDIEKNEKLLEFLNEHPNWVVRSMERTAPTVNEVYSYGSHSPVLIPAGNGSITLTITVFL